MSFRFLHLADPHIDSPMKGLERIPDAPIAQLRDATRDAFRNAVTYAINERLPLVVIAGDIFDEAWQTMTTGLWVVEQLRRLSDEGIHVCLIRGNHDSASDVPARLTWPRRVHEFAADRPETFQLPETDEFPQSVPVFVHGQSFAGRAVTEDLAANYPHRREGAYNIGVLHTSLEGNAAHATYAPTSVSVLRELGYDYWALGHIHQRAIVSQQPPVVYAGNMQGRHVREIGPRGGAVVTLGGGPSQSDAEIAFVDFDTVRWNELVVESEDDDVADDLIAKAAAACDTAYAEAGGRLLALRVRFVGVTAEYDRITAFDSSFESEVRSALRQRSSVWIEKVVVQVRPPIDLDELRTGGGILGLLLEDFDAAPQQSDDERRDEIDAIFRKLRQKAARRQIDLPAAGVVFDDSFATWSDLARDQLLATLHLSD